jgi:hypothetical protein
MAKTVASKKTSPKTASKKTTTGYEVIVPSITGNGLALVKWAFPKTKKETVKGKDKWVPVLDEDKKPVLVPMIGTAYLSELDKVDEHNRENPNAPWTYRFAVKDQWSKQAATRLLLMMDNAKFISSLKKFTK